MVCSMPAPQLIKILSIDGGGIRGIIPAMVLAEIERQTGRPACELFDLIAGTSTGGIITLGVTAPGEEQPDGKRRPRWSAEQLVDIYTNDGPQIFKHSLLRTIETLDGLVREKYKADGLEDVLREYLGDAMLSQALTKVLITSYDIQQHEPFFFKSFQPSPRAAPDLRDAAPGQTSSPTPQLAFADYLMRVVGRATSAAPTYFKPEDVTATPPGTTPRDYVLVDGGTFANNPAMCAYAEARRNYPEAEVLIVSLGTGRLTESISFKQSKHWGLVQWARPLLGVMMDGSSTAIDYQLDELLGYNKDHFRFQALLNGASDSLDDTSPKNIANLRKVADTLIDENAPRLKAVCARLLEPVSN
jgi:patatin-like phospholipase/acyl hydrolase